MHFTLRRLLLLSAACVLLALGPGESVYEVDQFGPAVSMISLRSSGRSVAAALSSDGTTFRLHRAEGVFIDKSPIGFAPGAAIRGIDQVRGDSGTDLVVSFNAPMVVEAREDGAMVRYVFVAASEATLSVEATPAAIATDPGAERKIAELRDLVRQLTLEVVEQRKKLARCGK